MEPALRVALEAVHASPVRAVVHVTGGAAQSLGWVMAVPGASRTLLEARVPYAREAMIDCLGSEPAQYVSASTARDLARAAYKRGVKLSSATANDHRHVVGIGCTCALASVTVKKGAHRCVVSTYGVLGSATYELNMRKGLRDRWEEDGLASRLVVQALVDAAAEAEAKEMEARDGRSDAVDKDKFTILLGLTDGDTLSTERKKLDDPITSLIAGDTELVEFTNGELSAVGVVPYGHLVLPGSFNPVHGGHLQMMKAASLMKPELAIAFELAISNVDKGTIPLDVLVRRAKQFENEGLEELRGASDLNPTPDASENNTPKLLLTRAPLFSTKAKLLPGSVFVVGHDTAIRLVMPKYYGGEENMLHAFSEIRNNGCSFIVAGRKSGDDVFLTLNDVSIPPSIKDLFTELKGFRNDFSSSEIRKQRGEGG